MKIPVLETSFCLTLGLSWEASSGRIKHKVSILEGNHQCGFSAVSQQSSCNMSVSSTCSSQHKLWFVIIPQNFLKNLPGENAIQWFDLLECGDCQSYLSLHSTKWERPWILVCKAKKILIKITNAVLNCVSKTVGETATWLESFLVGKLFPAKLVFAHVGHTLLFHAR